MKIQQTQRKGFTLIELLTAVTITVAILGVLIGTTTMTMDSWKESRDRARSATQAKECLDVLAKDLESAVYRSGNEHEWLYIKMDDNGDELGPDVSGASAEIQNPIEFGFLTAATDRYDGNIGGADDKGGDVSASVYRLVFKDQMGGDRPVYTLYRKLINPDEAFENYLGQTSMSSEVNSDEVIEAENFVAENIYNLSVTILVEYTDTSGNLKRQRIPVIDGSDATDISLKGDGLTDSNGTLLTINGDTIPKNASIVSVELGVVVLNEALMKSLNQKPYTDASFKEALKENSNYYSKSVLMARP